MDNRILQLAGLLTEAKKLPVTPPGVKGEKPTESKNPTVKVPVAPPGADKKLKPVKKGHKVMENAIVEDVTAHFAAKGNGQGGNIFVLDADQNVAQFAAMLGVPSGWKLTQIKNGLWAAFNEGDRLSFFTSQSDFQPDDQDGETNDNE
jgi:hypothetical protein